MRGLRRYFHPGAVHCDNPCHLPERPVVPVLMIQPVVMMMTRTFVSGHDHHIGVYHDLALHDHESSIVFGFAWAFFACGNNAFGGRSKMTLVDCLATSVHPGVKWCMDM
jgi:hypothetical protein